MSTHPSYHNHSSPVYYYYYYYGNHQQQQPGYNPYNANYSSFGGSGGFYAAAGHDYFARQFWDQYYQTLVFQPPLPSYYSVNIVLPSLVYSPYGPIWIHPVPYYEQLIQTSGNMLHNISDMTSQLTDQERNSNVDLDSDQDDDMYDHDHEESQERNSNSDSESLYDNVLHLLDDDMYDHDHEEKEDYDDTSNYLKIRTHHAPAKDGVDPEVEADDVESSEICVICHSEYKHEESIGTLQCRHDYHTDCIKRWLLKKKDCPMCRASVLPSPKKRRLM